MRRLIINADDLGLTAGVNRGIVECISSGVVTSATIMANAGAHDDALAAVRDCVRQRPNVSFGCHVVLADGAPVSPPAKISSLLSRSEPRQFPPTLSQFAVRVIGGLLDHQQLESEVTAQIKTLQAAGVPLSHVDTHKHAHVFASVARTLLRAAKSCGVHRVRNPFAPLRPLVLAQLLRRPQLWKRYSEVHLLRGFARRFREMVNTEGMLTTDGTFGIVVTGALDQDLFEAIAGCIPHGTWEFCCHPGYNDPDLSAVRTRLRESRSRELEVLTSDQARGALAKHGVELISYWDLQ